MRGGKRQNSGRKSGTANKRTREIADAAAAEGITPLEYMLAILRNPLAGPDDRMDAAKSAAPYIHPRLQAVAVSGDEDKPLQQVLKISWES